MSKQSGPPPGYVEVSERIVEFRAKHPDGCLQSEIVPSPFEGFVVVKAYAYRDPSDERPGVGLAWEPVPGKTNFTRDSELMNAETSAWGRALVALGAADAKRGIASANEVRSRQAEPAQQPPKPAERNARQDAVKAALDGMDAPQKDTLKGLWTDEGLPLDLTALSDEQCDRAMQLVEKVAEVPF